MFVERNSENPFVQCVLGNIPGLKCMGGGEGGGVLYLLQYDRAPSEQCQWKERGH